MREFVERFKALRTAGKLEEGITFLYLLLLFTLFLFGGGQESYRAITRNKFVLYCALTGGYIILMAACLVAHGFVERYTWKKLWDGIRSSHWAQRFAVAYLLVSWVSTFCSPDWKGSLIGVSRFEGACTITLYVISFLLVSVYGRGNGLLLGVVAAAAGIFGVICTIQLAGGNPFGLYPGNLRYADAYIAYPGAYLGTIGNVGLVAAFFSLILPLLVYALIRLPGKARWLLALPLGICLYVLAKMYVLAGFVGVGMGCLMALPVAGFRQRRQRLWAGIALGALLLAGLCLVFFVDVGSGMFHEMHQLLHGNINDDFGSGRVYIWRNVLARVPERLWLGHGPDTMNLAGMEFRHYNERLGREVVSRIDLAHNELLNVLYHQGVLGAGAYLGMLAALLAGWVKGAAKNSAVAVLGAGVLGYCLQAMFGFSLVMTAPFFWAVAGLLTARLTASQAGSPVGVCPSGRARDSVSRPCP